MKKRRILCLGFVMAVSVLCCGCGKKYTCTRCEKEVSTAYYDPFDEDRYFCEDCIQEYLEGFPGDYNDYKVK